MNYIILHSICPAIIFLIFIWEATLQIRAEMLVFLKEGFMRFPVFLQVSLGAIPRNRSSFKSVAYSRADILSAVNIDYGHLRCDTV